MANKKGYDFAEVEPRIMKFWEDEKVFKFDLKKKNIYSIDTPPPTVSGNMHIGHTSSYTQQDFIARFRRMKGGVFYPFGTDDNGLPTERLVERLKGVKSKDMSRAEFIELCLKTIKEINEDFIYDWKRIGISADYDVYYSTIDDNSRKISQKSFIDLYNAGEIYQEDFPTIWCPECQTSIAQAELEDREKNSKFSTLKFFVGNSELHIATTRPELLPACVAVFVNPKDERYRNFVGKKACVPLCDVEVPIIEDESAEIDKGTGVLMVCSYGDRFDVDAINRHKLEPRVILDYKGEFTEGPYKGLKIEEARKRILDDLRKNNLIVEEKDITHAVNTHDKCGTVIEFIPTRQWFIKVVDKKDKLIEQGKKIKWNPSHMFKRYENWVKGLEWDWSISRDRHFGVAIPVWHCENCDETILAEESELPVDPLQTEKKCPKCGNIAKPEEKVLDTWATSSLTPQIASSLVGEKIKIPFSLRPQAHDIIRTWAFYTITKAYLHEKKIPWKDVMVSGFVTLEGEKMSKSKGTGIDPREVIEKYGADALRFWAAGIKLGEDLDYQEQDLVAGKKMITKLWNASKFVFMNLKGYDGKSRPEKLEKIDTAFLQKLNSVVKCCTDSFYSYEYSRAKYEIERFFWKDFCDNYLEIVKKRVYNDTGDKKLSAQYTLYNGLLYILKILSPVMPFLTEEIYQTYFKDNEGDKSIHLSNWPENEEVKSSVDFDSFVEILSKVRQEKTNKSKSMKAEIILGLGRESLDKIRGSQKDLADVTNAQKIKTGEFSVEFIE